MQTVSLWMTKLNPSKFSRCCFLRDAFTHFSLFSSVNYFTFRVQQKDTVEMCYHVLKKWSRQKMNLLKAANSYGGETVIKEVWHCGQLPALTYQWTKLQLKIKGELAQNQQYTGRNIKDKIRNMFYEEFQHMTAFQLQQQSSLASLNHKKPGGVWKWYLGNEISGKFNSSRRCVKVKLRITICFLT